MHKQCPKGSEIHGIKEWHRAYVPIRGEGTAIVDDIIRMKVLEFRLGRTDQHVAHEESMVSASADDTHAYPVALIPSRKAINNIDAVPGVEVVDSTLTVDAPDLQGDSISELSHVRGFRKGGARMSGDAGQRRLHEACRGARQDSTRVG